VSAEFRRPLPTEAAAMARLHVQCWQESYAEIMPAEVLAKHDFASRLAMWQSLLADETAIVAAAFDGGSAVGFAIAGSNREKRFAAFDGQLMALYVARRFQTRGIGRGLMARAAQQWLGRGGRSLLIEVLADNVSVCRFYERLGGRFLGVVHGEGRSLSDAYYVVDDLAKFDKVCQES
jgi:ribosomal protein S18 acetylase RimI-like enzyme